jgi:hypothetical protein
MAYDDCMVIDWNTWGTWVGAVGTWFCGAAALVAVGYAIKLQRWYEQRDRPSLNITLDPESHENLKYVPPKYASTDSPSGVLGKDERQEELWLRVGVENSKGAVAKDVEVRLREIRQAGDTYGQSRESLWFKAASINSTSVNMLSKGIIQYFDIGYVQHSWKPVSQMFLRMALFGPDDVKGKTWDEIKGKLENDRKSKLQSEQKFTLCVVVQSSNAEARCLTFSIKLNLSRSRGNAMGENALKSLLSVEDIKALDAGAAFE